MEEIKRKRERNNEQDVQESDRALLSRKGVNKELIPFRGICFTIETPHTGEVGETVQQPSHKIKGTICHNDPRSLSEDVNPLVSSKGKIVGDGVPEPSRERRD